MAFFKDRRFKGAAEKRREIRTVPLNVS